MTEAGALKRRMGETLRVELVPLYLAVVAFPLAIILGIYFPNVGTFVSGAWYFLFGVILYAALASMFPTVYYAWLNGTAKDVAGDKGWFMSHSERFPLVVEPVKKVDLELIERDLNRSEAEEAKRLRAMEEQYGEAFTDRSISVNAYSLGGGNNFGFRSITPFTGGIVIARGDGHHLMLGKNRVWLHPIVKRHHSAFSREELAEVRVLPGVDPDKTAFYSVSPNLFPEITAWLQKSIEPQTVVLNAIGFNGMVRLMWDDFRALADADKYKVDDPTTRKAMVAVFESYLAKQVPLRLATSQNWANAENWANKAFDLQAQLHRVTMELETERQMRAAAVAGMHARVERQAKLAGGNAEEDPAWAAVDRNRSGPRETGERR